MFILLAQRWPSIKLITPNAAKAAMRSDLRQHRTVRAQLLLKLEAGAPNDPMAIASIRGH